MGLNRLEDEEEEQHNGQEVDGYLPHDAWHRLARKAQSCFRTAPSFHYMWVSPEGRKASFQAFIHGYVQVHCITIMLCPCLIHTPVGHFIRNGAFHVEPPPPKPRVERQLKASTKQVKRIMPTQVNRFPWCPSLYDVKANLNLYMTVILFEILFFCVCFELYCGHLWY